MRAEIERAQFHDIGQEIFAYLVERGPQFWLDYEQYKLARAKGDQPHAIVVPPSVVAVYDAGEYVVDSIPVPYIVRESTQCAPSPKKKPMNGCAELAHVEHSSTRGVPMAK
jgi:hypothetical protein